MDIVDRLTQVLDARRKADPDSSYVAALYTKGLDKILEKVGEEAVETILAAKNLDAAGDGPDRSKARQALLGEAADLWFHSMVMLMALDCQPAEVLAELDDRFGLSGIEEKATRSTN